MDEPAEKLPLTLVAEALAQVQAEGQAILRLSGVSIELTLIEEGPKRETLESN